MRTIHRDIAGAFTFSNDKQLLLVQTNKGGVYEDTWIVPGGGIETDESKLEAMKREVLEEVGIDTSDAKIDEITLLLSGESEKTIKETGERVLVKMQFISYRVDIPRSATNIMVQLDEELSAAQWFSVSELPSIKLTPTIRQTLAFIGYTKSGSNR